MARPPLVAALFVLAITAWRLWSLFHFPYDLYGDEAQYWEWSLNPAFGYYSKPPVVAWMIAASTSLCGDSTFCIRLPALLAHLLTAGVIYLLAQRLFPARKEAGAVAAIAYASLPAVTLSSHIVSTDAFLLLFWACFLLFAVNALSRPRWWLAAGVAAGLGMMSKYNAVMLAPSTLLMLWLSRRHRHHLRSPWIWAGAVVAALIVLPNLWWNAAHDWVSFRHTGDNAALEREWGNPKAGLEFLAAQAAVLGPVFFIGLAAALWRWRQLLKDEAWQFLASYAVPWLALVTVLAFLTRAHANWSAPAYVAGAAMAGLWLWKRPRWFYAGVAVNVLIAAAFMHFQDLGITLKRDPFARLSGWKALGETVAARRAEHPDAVVLVDDRMLFATLTYYLPPRPNRSLAKWDADGAPSDHYDLFAGVERFPGKPFLLITRQDAEAYRASFGGMERLEDVAAGARRYRAYLLGPYRGRP